MTNALRLLTCLMHHKLFIDNIYALCDISRTDRRGGLIYGGGFASRRRPEVPFAAEHVLQRGLTPAHTLRARLRT